MFKPPTFFDDDPVFKKMTFMNNKNVALIFTDFFPVQSFNEYKPIPDE